MSRHVMLAKKNCKQRNTHTHIFGFILGGLTSKEGIKKNIVMCFFPCLITSCLHQATAWLSSFWGNTKLSLFLNPFLYYSKLFIPCLLLNVVPRQPFSILGSTWIYSLVMHWLVNRWSSSNHKIHGPEFFKTLLKVCVI